MSVFSRRTIQRCLDQNASVVTVDQHARHIRLLNQGTRDSLATEWEVVLLRAFDEVGEVVHEARLNGPRRPDLLFTCSLRTDPPNRESGALVPRLGWQMRRLLDRVADFVHRRPPTGEFIADITVVSDKTVEKENPYDYFREEFGRELATKGLTLGGFDFQVGGDAVGEEYRDRKMMLHLPPKNDTRRFIKQHFAHLVAAVADRPNGPHSAKVALEGIDITVKYDPSKRDSVTGGHPSYNIAYSLTRNPLANALKSKAQQLRQTGYKGAKGIICCDGGCGIFGDRMSGGSHYGHREIVQHFFRKNSSISFVALIWVADVGWIWTGDRRRELQCVVYTSAMADPSLCLDSHQAIHAALRLLPKPI
ncbi:MAG: hypothetical protein JXO22_04910, partial [Phycisphaerae bacterium]|nr:hypothetical protein [Phycisphaerae bacterium]